MKPLRPAVIGLGATGTVLAAALLREHPDTVLVVRREEQAADLRQGGLTVTGELEFSTPARHVVAGVDQLGEQAPNLVFLCTKTFDLEQVLGDVARVCPPGTAVVSTHNGLGPEDLVARSVGAANTFRLSLNYGSALTGPGRAQVAFFNRPNPMGGVVADNRGTGQQIARSLTDGGLDTEYVDDIRLFVWKKMVMKCTMASICAVTDRTIKGALLYPPTREIADACFAEAMAVAKAEGYALGPDYLKQALDYLEQVGIHKDSMCADVASRRPTEIEFLGGKVVEYAEKHGIEAPRYRTMTNLVRAIQDSYLRETA